MSLDTSVLAVIETLYEFLDRSPVAIVLLDGQQRVVFANALAAALHARADGITIGGSGIGLLRAPDNARLQSLIARATACDSEAPARSMRALRSSGKRPYGLLVAPLSRRDRDASQTAYRPAVCIVVADTDGARTLPVERLKEAFDLTEAEGRLAARLAAGEGLRSVAHALGITYGTARARLAEVFQKTETRRQGELINLLLTTLAAV
jgi:DNA-binding CsgD family transcriptional regulator